MNDSIQINQKQLMLVMANLLIVKMMFSFPRLLFKTSGNAAWIQGIYITVLAYIILEASIWFYKYTGNRSILQLSESIGKKPLKIIIGLIVAAIFAINVSSSMRTFAESVKLILLPNTKIEYIMILFSFTVALGSFCGFGALSVINALFLPICLFFLAILGISLIESCQVNNIMPFWGTGIRNIFVIGIRELYCFADILAFNLLLPYCGDISSAKRGSRRAVLIGGIVITLICLVYGMIYPYPFSSEFLLTSYQLTRLVRAGEYFQRFEALFEFVWSMMQLLYSSIYVFLICSVLKDAFGLRYQKALIPAVTAVTAILAFEADSVTELVEMSGKIMIFISPFAFLLPILIPLLYTLIKGRKRDAS